MKHWPVVVLTVTCLFLMDSQVTFGRFAQRGPVRTIRSLDDADPNARICLLAHDIGNVNMTFGNYGELGCPNGTPGFSGFEFPIGSGNDFLFSAGLWVGAEVNGVSCVSTTTDGDNGTNEFWPVHIGTVPAQDSTSYFGDWHLSSSAFDSAQNRYYLFGVRELDDDGDWTLADDLNGDNEPSADWDGDSLDANGDGNPNYDPEPHIDEDPAGDVTHWYLDPNYVAGAFDDDGDGTADEDAAAWGFQEHVAVFQDSIELNHVGSPDPQSYHPLQVMVEQRSFAWPGDFSGDFVFIEYRIRNFGTDSLHHVYLALFADADVTASGEGGDAGSLDDSTFYDSSRMMMVTDDSNTDADGSAPGAIGFRVVRTPAPSNDLRITYSCYERISGGDPYTDADKYNVMSSGVIAPASPSYGDWRMVLSFGEAAGNGFDLPPGGELPIMVAVVGGSSLAELVENADSALHIIDEDTVVVTSVEPSLRPVIPNVITLHQNYPNPFNPTTEIRFNLAAATKVELSIFNTLGQRVATVLNETKPAGSHRVQWDGSGVASGVYLYRLRAGDFWETRKMVLMR